MVRDGWPCLQDPAYYVHARMKPVVGGVPTWWKGGGKYSMRLSPGSERSVLEVCCRRCPPPFVGGEMKWYEEAVSAWYVVIVSTWQEQPFNRPSLDGKGSIAGCAFLSFYFSVAVPFPPFRMGMECMSSITTLARIEPFFIFLFCFCWADLWLLIQSTVNVRTS